MPKLTLVCARCGVQFQAWPSDRKKYCSMKCRDPEPVQSVCLTCNVPLTGKPSRPRKYCSFECHGVARRELIGERGVNWKGGRSHDSNGYAKVYVGRGHPMTTKNSPYVREHRLVMADHLGRMLTHDEIVHHVNGDRLDNRIENLRLMTSPEHAVLHGTGRSWSLPGWSRQHEQCVGCGTQERGHKGHGLCENCYMNARNTRLRAAANIQNAHRH